MPNQPVSAWRRFIDGIVDATMMTVVAGLSLLILVYVGLGEATRTYQDFQVEKLVAQGRVMQSTMEAYLRPGLTMKNFAGFNALSDRIRASDPAIAAIGAFDRQGNSVFSNGDRNVGLMPRALDAPAEGKDQKDGFELRIDDRYLQVILPLRDRFEVVGTLAISMPRSTVAERVDTSFHRLVVIACATAFAFGVFVAIGGPRFHGKSRRWLTIGYTIAFVGMSGSVIVTLVNLYSEGAQSKTRALAALLGQRLNSIVQSGLNITEIHGLDRVFAEYKRLNPNIKAVALSVDGIVRVHTEPKYVGRPWVVDGSTFEYHVPLTRPGGRDIRISVALPVDVIYGQITRSVKDFTALFVASAFMANLFLQLAGTLRGARRRPGGQQNDYMPTQEERDLNRVKPVFFVGVFVEHLTYSFLSQHLHQVAAGSALSQIAAAALFMSYYVFFAGSLIPAGYLAQRFGSRLVMLAGLSLSAAGLGLLAVSSGFVPVLVARALSGIGQGILFIAVQSFILAVASRERRTQAAGIIVFGFQGGMISGMAMGSLLVTKMGTFGVFSLAAAIAAAMSIYVSAFVPSAARQSAIASEPSLRLRDITGVLRSGEFMRTILLVGVPAKAILTGVIIFAMPLLMSNVGYPPEDIGQILMVYAAGVLLASGGISRLVDRSGRTEQVLMAGAVLSGAGMIIIGLVDQSVLLENPHANLVMTILLIVGAAVVGAAHGCINAPVVTHVANAEVSARIGETTVTATYRFLERIGHILGPIVVGQAFIVGGQRPAVIGILGGVVVILGLVFAIRPAEPRRPPAPKGALS
ncbi:MAG: MFS transporter [Alphaproteobacteria bacterium]|nr:MFS transporter [Alphaproteobacteria bacterium]